MNMKMQITVLFVFFVVRLPLAAAYTVGESAPDFAATDRRTGEPVQFHSLEGKIIILDFFAYWCPPCVVSSPDVRENVHDYYAARGGNIHGLPVQVVFVNIEHQNPAATDQFIEDHRLEMVWDDFDRAGWNVFNQTSGVPLFAVVNGVTGSVSHADWEILWSRAGYSGAPHLRSLVDSIEPPVSPPLPWADIPADGFGWRHLAWFGTFSGEGNWIFHNGRGWLYASGREFSDLWFYDPDEDAWEWTSEEIYPWVFRIDDSSQWVLVTGR